MNSFVIALTSFCGLCAFAFLLAGEAALAALSDDELQSFARRAGKAPAKMSDRLPWFGELLLQADMEILRRLKSHWKERADARGLIYAGLGFLAATIAGVVWLLVV